MHLKRLQHRKKAEIQESDGVIARLSEAINNGYEYRDVECRIAYDFQAKIKTWYRTDTGEVEKQDIISEGELQEEMSL